jgi:hypothetical protein
MFIPCHHIFAVILAAAHLFGPFDNINFCIFLSVGYSSSNKYNSPVQFYSRLLLCGQVMT